ncbi:MAG: tetratricopeptide repeat protein [Bacteroidia bacterium]|nr:tetratricopeptide repeat protein [Bacteroidia bacterium]
MILKQFIRIPFLLAFVLISAAVYSQKTLIYDNPYMKSATDLFDKQKYGAAQKKFQEIIKSDADLSIKTDAEYFSALCAIELFNADAEYLLTKFIENHPESDKIKTAYFQMGRFMYRDKKFKNAVNWFEKVDKYELKKDELAEYYFKGGYSYFVMNDFDKAVKSFYEIKESGSEYADAALYYYSHINYVNQNYETALIGFIKLTKNEQFSPIVPYYICQTYYLQEKYDKVIEYAPSILDSATTKRGPEIARVIGESYYRTNHFKEAIPYLEMYDEKTDAYKREDRYELAYAYYKINDVKKAAKYFEEVLDYKDKLSQNVFYHAADCYLKMNEKQKARMAFHSASRLDFDAAMKEDALYNYAKLTYELSFYPFNEAIKAFKEYIDAYPQSPRVQESYTYLVKAYMSTRNYKDALASMDLIPDKKDDIKEAYQRAAYYRGIEFFSNLDFKKAIEMINRSLQYKDFNKNITAQSYYWKAEAFYRTKNYDSSITFYKTFLESYGAFQMPQFQMSYYNLGYCYFNKKDYKEALSWFRKFEKEATDKKSKYMADGCIRAGDCYFMNRSYADAMAFYDKAVELNLNDVDYALYQKGLSLGLLKKHEDKINALQKLVSDFPKSSYIDDAVFEIATSYKILDSKDLAIANYKKIIEEYPEGCNLKKALLDIGQIYRGSDNYDEAVKVYKRVIEEFKGTTEASSAMIGLKNVYVDKNDVDAYFEYAKAHGEIADVSQTEKDSLTYQVAEKLYLDGDCGKSKEQFKKYIDNFPNGLFLLNANYYSAECDYHDNELEDALAGYAFVASKPKNIFTEPAVLNSATINFELKNYNDAFRYFTTLEKIAEVKNNILMARQGQMRSAYLANNHIAAIDAAKSLMKTDKITEENIREAQYILAQSLFIQNRLDEALPRYKIIARETKSREGAESKYKIALIYFIQSKDSLAQTEIYDFVEKNTSHQYWLAKGFLLLADIFIRQKDDFQAKQTLQSIIENYSVTNDEIIPETNDRLVKIVEREKQMQQAKDTVKVFEQLKFDKEGKYNALFNDSLKQNNDTISSDKNEILDDIEQRQKEQNPEKKKDVIHKDIKTE